MQTNTRPERVSQCVRRAWLPLLALSLYGGGGSSDDTQAHAASIPEGLRGHWETCLTYVPALHGSSYGNTAQGDGSIGITFNHSPDGQNLHLWDLAQAYFGDNCFSDAAPGESRHGHRDGLGVHLQPRPGHLLVVQLVDRDHFVHVGSLALDAE